ncbi:MAG: hypothetical protein OXN25_18865 [Candidatus Poribacteria bacterium]|nr:hypothetical protein [Candidatus Poribacteria bacterium]
MSVLTQILTQGTVDVQSLRDIKPPLEVAQSLLPYFIGGTIVLGFIAVSGWLLYIRKRSQTLPMSPIQENEAPLPHEVAYEQLTAIEASDWLKRGDMKTYHTQIAYVLREYIYGRYQIPALELTTTALLRTMRRERVDTPYVERIQQLLSDCDRVKFASYQPKLSEATARIADARWIVDETKLSIS